MKQSKKQPIKTKKVKVKPLIVTIPASLDVSLPALPEVEPDTDESKQVQPDKTETQKLSSIESILNWLCHMRSDNKASISSFSDSQREAMISEVESQTLPASFNLPEFKKEVFVMLNTMIGYFGDEELNNFHYELLPFIVRCLVTSSEFLKDNDEGRVTTIKQLQSLAYVVTLLQDVFTQEVIENNYCLGKELKACLSPNT